MNFEERKVTVENLENKNIDSDATDIEKKEIENQSDEGGDSVDVSETESQKKSSDKPLVDKKKSDTEDAVEENTSASEEAEAVVEEEKDSSPDAVEEKDAGSEDSPDTESQEDSTKEPSADESDSEQEDVVEDSTADAEAKVEEQKDSSTKDEEEPKAEEAAEEEPDAKVFYTEILEKAKEIVVQTDWAFVTQELSSLDQQVSGGPDSENEEVSKLIEEFQELRSSFEQKKRDHYDEQNRRKEENLAKKKDLLKTLSTIVSEENWTATKEVGQVRGKWESIKLLPQKEVEGLEKKYKELMDEFEDHKVDRLVKKLQKEEENLELKLLLLDKMDEFVKRLEGDSPNFTELEDEFNKLISQWRKVGRVPSEKNQALWDRFNKVQDTFNEMRFKFDEEYRKVIEKALEKKKKLVKEAEALVDQENIAKAARKVNKLHKAWKGAGNLPQKDENEMWDRFKAATDKFNDLKSDNLDILREQEEANLEKKMGLIEKAKAEKDTEDFDAGHQIMQNLMSEWKKIGPVPRKKSSKIWKQFKGTMDEFYDRRREAFKGERKDQKENLAKKEELLEKLKELGAHEDPALAVQEAKKVQSEFKDIGYVPIKTKNKIWKQYREACDVIYDRYRALGDDLGMEKKLANQGIDPDTRKDIIKFQKERDKLKKEVSKLESEMIQYEEAKTYFKPTNRGNALRDEIQEKIDKADNAIEAKKDRMQELYKNIDQLKRSTESADEEE